jgi:hypothetical protein
MADNSSSSVVAIFAIVVIVGLLIGAYYFFGNKVGNAPSTPNVKVSLPTPGKK